MKLTELVRQYGEAMRGLYEMERGQPGAHAYAEAAARADRIGTLIASTPHLARLEVQTLDGCSIELVDDASDWWELAESRGTAA